MNEYAELESILNQRMLKRAGGQNQRLAMMLGWLTKNKNQPVMMNIPSEDRSMFSLERYKFLLDAPFEISNKCCSVMKKEPAHRYSKETNKYPITAQMAVESRLRLQKWLQHGCNAFDAKNPISNPLSFWTEQDILHYIKQYDIKIASVYGDVVVDFDKENTTPGQTSFIPDYERPLKVTGCKRTGCMFCGFGCHLNKDTRFLLLKEMHPQIYDYIMKSTDVGGLGYKKIIEWINEHGNFNILY